MAATDNNWYSFLNSKNNIWAAFTWASLDCSSGSPKWSVLGQSAQEHAHALSLECSKARRGRPLQWVEHSCSACSGHPVIPDCSKGKKLDYFFQSGFSLLGSGPALTGSCARQDGPCASKWSEATPRPGFNSPCDCSLDLLLNVAATLSNFGFDFSQTKPQVHVKNQVPFSVSDATGLCQYHSRWTGISESPF